ncbi:MAG: hypothetical protein GY870_17720 [archaeon]|nr:hypothetical protein [archaeon]
MTENDNIAPDKMNKEALEKETRNWLNLSIELLGVTLTVLILMWSLMDIIPSVSYILLGIIPIFVNSIAVNSTLISDSAKKKDSKFLRKMETFAGLTFGLGYTGLLCAFAIIAYAVMNQDIIAPMILMVSAWIMMVLYHIVYFEKKPGSVKRSFFKNLKRLLWLSIEALTIFILYLDYINVYNWIIL